MEPSVLHVPLSSIPAFPTLFRGGLDYPDPHGCSEPPQLLLSSTLPTHCLADAQRLSGPWVPQGVCSHGVAPLAHT